MGPKTGNYFYTRDHLGSIREITDSTGNVRARYIYDSFGHRTKLAGDLDADFGFTGMFFAAEAGLLVARFRAYDPNLGRWLSRDPLRKPELSQGPNLFAYVGNNPVNKIDPSGLATKDCCNSLEDALDKLRTACDKAWAKAEERCAWAEEHVPEIADEKCYDEFKGAKDICTEIGETIKLIADRYFKCMTQGCGDGDRPCPGDCFGSSVTDGVQFSYCLGD